MPSYEQIKSSELFGLYVCAREGTETDVQECFLSLVDDIRFLADSTFSFGECNIWFDGGRYFILQSYFGPF